MSYKIKTTPEFENRFKDLTKKDRMLHSRLVDAIKKLSEYPRSGKPLSYDLAGLWSLRVGKYRIIYEIDEESGEIRLITVGHREKIY